MVLEFLERNQETISEWDVSGGVCNLKVKHSGFHRRGNDWLAARIKIVS